MRQFLHKVRLLIINFQKTNLLWLFFIILSFVAIAYSVHRYNIITYWDGAIGNLVATWLGIVLGVPIALTIERRRQYREEQEKILHKSEISQKIYQLLKNELAYNEQKLQVRKNDTKHLDREPLKCTLWEVLCDSGEIKEIDDPIILDKLATAYYYIKIVIDIESKLYQAMRGINVQYPDGRSASQLLSEEARYFDGILTQRISEAYESLESKLLKF